ncbi:hypothetical protein PhCBS80983_g05491 [Powellomyces hirtus]|uniref:Integrator complex subunit 11 n=1 Tax=Powellomyces hirtus TaxID=109895 RepID=A0A507DVA5_9FUNG|nr:hypothetical protein PhCBS80983_g05491 [Powellomyces hirtus]
MGYSDHRRFPDFKYLSNTGNYDAILDCVIVSHFHLDHCGALPHFTEQCGYSGPIYMTYPTKAICPILLEDMRKVSVERKGEKNFFTSEDIKNCMKKVIPVDLHQTIKVDSELEIKAYYAGHVLGAAMFHIRVGNESVVYTGDYNMTPDRHLGAAWIDKCRPDLLITETTYATYTRESKRTREYDFLKKVHDCVRNGGKVLIPVFALGRAQELCILIEAYWERMEDLRGKIPVYFSAGMTERANEYYKLFINWTNEKIKSTFVDRNMFDFKYISTYKFEYGDLPGPMVVFASPGMLHAGTSLQVFKKWCHDPKNMVILPGYCVAGTVGSKVLAGQKKIQIDPHTRVDVNLQVENLSFSAHADAKGILQLIKMCAPKNVLLVHGEAQKMEVLKGRIHTELKIPTFNPANGEMVTVGGIKDPHRAHSILVDATVVRKAWDTALETSLVHNDTEAALAALDAVEFTGTLVRAPNGTPTHILPPPKNYIPPPTQVFTITKHIDPFQHVLPPPDERATAIFESPPQRRILAAVYSAIKQFLPIVAVTIHEQPKEPSGIDDVVYVRNRPAKAEAPIQQPEHSARPSNASRKKQPKPPPPQRKQAPTPTPFCVTLRMAPDPLCAIVVSWDRHGEDAAGRVMAILNATF